ncbi:J domain-containing protein [Rurimicrobium arvi]
MPEALNHYQILEIPFHASAADIKKAYRTQARRFHPDRNQGAEATTRFQEIQVAYEILSDPAKRKIYDRFIISSGFAAQQSRDNIYTVQQILKQAEGVRMYVAKSNGMGINYDALADFVMGILSTENIAIMKRQQNSDLNSSVVQTLLDASTGIQALRSFKEIAARVTELTGHIDATVLERLQEESDRRKKKEQQNRLVPYASLLLVVVFLIIMLLIVTRK